MAGRSVRKDIAAPPCASGQSIYRPIRAGEALIALVEYRVLAKSKGVVRL
jgi:hypothetical protein